MSAFGGRSSLTDAPRRITAPHGISPLERDLLTEGLDSMRRKGPLAFISVEAPAEPFVREISRSVKNVLALRQRRAGMRRGALWAEVRETKARDGSPKPGAHIVAPMPSASGRDGLIDAVNNSSVYGRNVFAESVTDVEGLKGYLLKEATPQAAFRTGVRRVKGSHPLAEGGDRVRLSPALRDSLIRAERVTPYQRTYAARRPRIAVMEPLNSDGQGLLFDVAETAPPTNSAPLPTPRPKRAPSPPTMFALFNLAPTADLIEIMKTLGPTHQVIAERIGISRAQVTNIINRQFGPSSIVVRRVLDLTKAA